MPTKTPRTRHTFARHVAPFAPVALGLLMQGSGISPSGISTQPATPTEAVTSAPAGGGFVEACPNPLFPSPDPTTIDQTSCTIAGSGGAEAFQNEAKNNFCPAAGPAKAITIADLLNLQAKVDQDVSIPFGNTRSHGTHPHGPATDRKPLQALGEGTLVTLQGFVLTARQEGKESVNCGTAVADTPSNHDIHISIVDSASQSDECSGVVAEMIPHHRSESWTAQNVNAVASKKLPVRLTGQLFFDSSHSPCKNGVPSSGDPKRIALWEVHPIYDFEVCTQGDCSDGKGWETLDQFVGK